jgi:hypothetical protein
LTFLEECADSLPEVVAIVSLAAEGLESLIGFWIQRVGIGQDTHLLFEDADDERRGLGDPRGQPREPGLL